MADMHINPKIVPFLIFFITGSISCLQVVSATEKTDSSAYKKEVKYIDSLMQLVNFHNAFRIDTNLALSEEALKRSLAIHYLRGELMATGGISSYHSSTGNLYKSLEFLFSKLEKHMKNDYYPGYVSTHCRISSVFLLIEDTLRSLEHINLADKIAQMTKDPEDITLVYLEKGKYFLHTEDYNRARDYGFLAKSISMENNNQENLGRSYRLLGDISQRLGEYGQSIYYFNLALKSFTQQDFIADVGSLYTRIAHSYMLKGDFQTARTYDQISLSIREQSGIMDLVGQSMINIGRVYLKMNRFDSSLYYLKKGTEIVSRRSNPVIIGYGYKQLYEFYLAQKDYKNAFIAYQTYESYHQKAVSQNNATKISILNSNWLINKMEYQNSLLTQENTLKKIQSQKRRMETILYEIGFLVVFFFTFFINNLTRGIKGRQKSLKMLTQKLQDQINEKVKSEEFMRQSEARYRILADNMVDVISLLDSNWNRIYVSPSCLKLFGYEPHEMLCKKPLDLIEPSCQAMVNEEISKMARIKKPTRYTFKALRKDGTTFWAESNVNPIYNKETGVMKEAISVIRDISERHMHEEILFDNERQKGFLLNEIHNRVKNNFSILISLMEMQRALTSDPVLSSSFADLQLRVKTMSLVHEQLYLDQDIHFVPLSDYLQHLTLIVSSAFKNDKITIHTDIDPCIVNIETVLPLGLIVNELMTNAFKYAFPQNRAGVISISLKPETPGSWNLTIRDNGIGLPSGFSTLASQSMGSQIIQILVQQVDATLKITHDDGACFRIIFPVNKN